MPGIRRSPVRERLTIAGVAPATGVAAGGAAAGVAAGGAVVAPGVGVSLGGSVPDSGGVAPPQPPPPPLVRGPVAAPTLGAGVADVPGVAVAVAEGVGESD